MEKAEIQYWWIEINNGFRDVARVLIREEFTAIRATCWYRHVEVESLDKLPEEIKLIARIYMPGETQHV